ncbi:e3 ubiquitin-protein ligase CCNB1IP1 [Trichonephila inaurata madagascariensis]|uniref:E3 ubiquitin-protein ligase CCNB1IP1 n=1 Tax=Trichonephila inaurata madagascariensis TaxID=2747483 RepID=A0A8X7C7Q0_9ARAC|nr:e3 ubiquitin-protein ligase CCNB1IP1 [Trichonephila inaurata madagascariensis]
MLKLERFYNIKQKRKEAYMYYLELEFEKAFICPACDTALSGKYDIVKVDLNPNEQYKSMVLAGQRPEVIFEICSRAISFWTYQTRYLFQKPNYLTMIRTRNELEASKKKTAELSEKLKERIRQHEKLQYLYEALRRKFISPSFFEKQNKEERLAKKTQDPFLISTASEIICPQGEKKTHRSKKAHFYTQIERDFVLRPAPTPKEDTIEQPLWNFSTQNSEKNI